MTQISSSTTPSTRPPQPAAEPASEARTAPGDGFAYLLAGLLGVVQPLAPQPFRPAVSGISGAATAETGNTPGEPAAGNRPEGLPREDDGGENAAATAGTGEPPAGTASDGSLPIDLPVERPGPRSPLAGGPGVRPSAPAGVEASGVTPAEAPVDAPLPGEQHRSPTRLDAGRPAPEAKADRALNAMAAPAERGQPRQRTAATADSPATASAALAQVHPGPRSLVAGELALEGITWRSDGVDPVEPLAGAGLVATHGALATGSVERIALSEPAAAGGLRPAAQLAAAIERAVNGELRQFTVQLSPSELGTIEIALEIDADRRIGVAILVERPETLDLLRQETRQLERLLAQQGLDLGDAGLELGLMSQERRNDPQRWSTAAMELASAEGEATPEAEALPSGPPRELLSPHRLNLSI